MYKELEKYKTNQKMTGLLHTSTSDDSYSVLLDKYLANLGDLLNDFIEHKKKPFWKRKSYHNYLTKIYIDMLNKITLTHGL